MNKVLIFVVLALYIFVMYVPSTMADCERSGSEVWYSSKKSKFLSYLIFALTLLVSVINEFQCTRNTDCCSDFCDDGFCDADGDSTT